MNKSTLTVLFMGVTLIGSHVMAAGVTADPTTNRLALLAAANVYSTAFNASPSLNPQVVAPRANLVAAQVYARGFAHKRAW